MNSSHFVGEQTSRITPSVLTCLSVCVFHFDLVRHAEPVHVIVRIPSGDLTLTSFKVSSVVKNSRHSDTIHSDIFTAYYLSLEDRRPIGDLTSKPRPNSEPALFFLFCANWAPRRGKRHGPPPARATAMTRFIFFLLHEPSRDPWHTARLRALERVPWPPLPPEPESTCYLPRRTPINGFRDRGERRLCPTTSLWWARREPVALSLTALAPQLSQKFATTDNSADSTDCAAATRRR